MGDNEIGRNWVLENYINDLIIKGYKKKDIKNKLLEGGYDKLIVNKYLYPYASILMIAGIILVVMIVVFVSVATYFIIVEFPIDNSGAEDSVTSSIPDNICRSFLENPERYKGQSDYAELLSGCSEFTLDVNDRRVPRVDKSISRPSETNCSEEYNNIEDEARRVLMEDRCFYNEARRGNLESCANIVDEEMRLECEERTADGLG